MDPLDKTANQGPTALSPSEPSSQPPEISAPLSAPESLPKPPKKEEIQLGEALGPLPLTPLETSGPETPADIPVPPPESDLLVQQEKQKIPPNLKKIVLFALVLIVLVLGAIFLFKSLSPKLVETNNVVLTYWGLWEPENVVGEIIADYQKNNPNVKINYVRSSPKDYRERLASAFARGEGPDIFRFHNTWIPMFRKELAPLPSTIMDAPTFESVFYPVARRDLRSGNSYVGIPLEIDGLALYVNEDIFRTAGRPYPTNWDEFRRTAIELTVRNSQGAIQISGAALGRTENIDHWSDILAVMMLQNGADLENPVGVLAEDALTYFTLFYRVDHVWDETLPSSTQFFTAGKLAMYFGPSWEAINIKQANPQLNFKTIPLPQLEGTDIAWASYWVEGVSRKSKNQEAAWRFLKYLSQKETLQRFYNAESKTRLFGEPYSRVDMADLLKNANYVGTYIQQAPSAKSWYLCSRTFDNGINDKIIKYFEDAVNAVNAGQDSRNALQTVASGVAQVLAQYEISSPVTR